MKPRHAPSSPFSRTPRPVAGTAPLLAALCLLLVGGSAAAQEIERLAPAESPGPAVDLWVESSQPDLDFGYWLSEPAHVAIFKVIPGLGTTLVLPERDGPRGPVEVGRRAAGGSHYASLRREERGFAKTLDGRWPSDRYGYGVGGPDRGYLLLVASRAPLHLWAFTRLDDYRHTAGALGRRTPYRAGIRTTAERLIELVVASPEAGGWSAAYLPYALRPHSDRFAFGRSVHSTSLCAYGLPGYGFLPFGLYRLGGYGIGLRSAHFAGYRGPGRASYGSGIGVWTDPFGLGFPPAFGLSFGGFGSPYRLGSACGFGFGRFPLHRFRDPFFPPRPLGPHVPPVDIGRKTAAIPPPSIFRRVPTPALEQPEPERSEAGSASALERTLVPVPAPSGRLELPTRALTPTSGSPGAPEPAARRPRATRTDPATRERPEAREDPAAHEPSLAPWTRKASSRILRSPNRPRGTGSRIVESPRRDLERLRLPSAGRRQGHGTVPPGVGGRVPVRPYSPSRIRSRRGSGSPASIRRPARTNSRPRGGQKAGDSG